MASAPVVIDLLGNSDDEAEVDGAHRSSRAASRAERPAPARPGTPSHKRRRLARDRTGVRAGGAGGGAAGLGDGTKKDEVIDLTGDDDGAMATAFRTWELIDLTRDEESDGGCAGASGAQAASPEAADALDVLAPQRAKIAKFLRSKRCRALQVARCDANPHAAPGTPLYARFAAALASVADKRVKLVFHGTPEANVDAILRDGLDPSLRRGQALGKGGALPRRRVGALARARAAVGACADPARGCSPRPLQSTSASTRR